MSRFERFDQRLAGGRIDPAHSGEPLDRLVDRLVERHRRNLGSRGRRGQLPGKGILFLLGDWPSGGGEGSVVGGGGVVVGRFQERGGGLPQRLAEGGGGEGRHTTSLGAQPGAGERPDQALPEVATGLPEPPAAAVAARLPNRMGENGVVAAHRMLAREGSCRCAAGVRVEHH